MSEKKSKETLETNIISFLFKYKEKLEIYISSFLFLCFGAGLLFITASNPLGSKSDAYAVTLGYCVICGFYLLYCLIRRTAYFRQKKSNEAVKVNTVDITSKTKTESKDQGIECSYLGGSGYFFHESEKVRLLLIPDAIRITLSESGASIDIPFTEIHEVDISGPGTTTNNAGISGGGFGLEGFVKGAVTAALINAATTRSSTNTFVRMLTITGELYLHTSEAEPAQLKIKMSQVFVYLGNKARNVSGTSMHGAVAEEITKLHKLKQDGLIDDDEYKAAKSKLLGISV